MFDGCLDRRISKIQGSHLIPLGRDALKICSSLVLAILTHQLQSPVVSLVRPDELSQNGVNQSPSPRFMTEAVEHLWAFGKPFDQTRIGHEFEMSGNARLALLKHTRQLHDRQFFTRQQPQNPETRCFAGSPKNLDDLFGA